MKDLNFIIIQPISKPVSFIRVFLVFGVAFIIVMGVLNAPGIFAQARFKFSFDETKNYEQLTNQYRALYGHPESDGNIVAPLPITYSNTLSIPKINISALLQQTNTTNAKELDAILKQGVLIYPGSAEPGRDGTTAVIGHSSSDLPWTKYSNVFALLGQLEPDDLIYLNYKDKNYVYAVTGKMTGTVHDLIQSGASINGDLVLSSCWPVGSDRGRILITAQLQKVE